MRMASKKRLIIMMMLAFWLLNYFGAVLFVSKHSGHSCTEAHCTVCSQIKTLQTYKKRLICDPVWNVSLAYLLAVLVIPAALQWIRVPDRNLVRQKVRLDC